MMIGVVKGYTNLNGHDHGVFALVMSVSDIATIIIQCDNVNCLVIVLRCIIFIKPYLHEQLNIPQTENSAYALYP